MIHVRKKVGKEGQGRIFLFIPVLCYLVSPQPQTGVVKTSLF